VLVGAYYAAFGAYVLVSLSSVTERWVVASGDIDSRLDYPTFRILAAILAVLIAVLGSVSVIHGLARLKPPTPARATATETETETEIATATAANASRLWLFLAVLAVPVQFVRLQVQHIDRTLTPAVVIWCIALCLLYATLWILERPSASTRRLTD
jgi:hypothetical protein